MAKVSIFGVLSNVYMLVHTALKGKLVGIDSFGNKYYKAKPRRGTTHDRRWVMYAQEAEASRVPPEWHGWLHHQTDDVPVSGIPTKNWIRPHQPNRTGTDRAYMPPAIKTGHRAQATGDYMPWRPPQ